MTFRAPVAEILFTLRYAAGFDRAVGDGVLGEINSAFAEQILLQAAKLVDEVIAPLNRIGDRQGPKLVDGVVITPPGWKQAYRAWVEGGWNGLTAPVDHGGQGLPIMIGAAVNEMLQSANMAFGNAPMLTMGAIDALHSHGSTELKQRYLAKLVSGEWTGTMNLTEPQAGSDLAALRTRAERHSDGTYRITGQKIFITYGEHDLTDNIVHLVLGRLPDAPLGTRGISLFLVPKVLPNGQRNDLRCHSLEHKLGIHGSPTCTMIYGDNGGATGWLIGQENRGLACMFTMMNNARLAVGLQGVGIAERATQAAIRYANERRQGRAPGASDTEMSPIIRHPDVRRMLNTMSAYTGAARAIAYLVAEALDRARQAPDEASRKEAEERASLLTPVAKAFGTDIGIKVASLGVQVHGGMGFIEETGVAQFLRDARIAAIYEGTNGIQAIDLVMRKLSLSGGRTVRARLAAMRRTVQKLVGAKDASFGHMAARLRETVEALDQATSYMLRELGGNNHADALAGATPYCRLFGLAQGGISLADMALAAAAALARGETDKAHAGHIARARFFAENLAPASSGLLQTILSGAGSVDETALAMAG